RDELEPTRRQPVVHRARGSTPRAPWPIAAMRHDLDRQGEARDLLLELDRAVDKSPMLLNPVQDSLDLHPAGGLRAWLALDTTILFDSTRDASCAAAARVEAAGAVDAQNAPTAPCKTTERFCTSSHTLHPLFQKSDESPQI